jgi:hypothetical protein
MAKKVEYRFEIIDPRLGQSMVVVAKTKLNAYLKALKQHNTILGLTGKDQLHRPRTGWEGFVFCLGLASESKEPTKAKHNPVPKKPWIDVPSVNKAKGKRTRKPNVMNGKATINGKKIRERVERMNEYNKKKGLSNGTKGSRSIIRKVEMVQGSNVA